MIMGTQPSISAQPPSQPSKKNWSDRFLSKIGDQLQDLTFVEIITASASSASIKIDSSAENVLDELNKANAVVLARTRIELDGDIVMLLPSDPQSGVKINKDIMDIHNESTKACCRQLEELFEYGSVISRHHDYSYRSYKNKCPGKVLY